MQQRASLRAIRVEDDRRDPQLGAPVAILVGHDEAAIRQARHPDVGLDAAARVDQPADRVGSVERVAIGIEAAVADLIGLFPRDHEAAAGKARNRTEGVVRQVDVDGVGRVPDAAVGVVNAHQDIEIVGLEARPGHRKPAIGQRRNIGAEGRARIDRDLEKAAGPTIRAEQARPDICGVEVVDGPVGIGCHEASTCQARKAHVELVAQRRLADRNDTTCRRAVAVDQAPFDFRLALRARPGAEIARAGRIGGDRRPRGVGKWRDITDENFRARGAENVARCRHVTSPTIDKLDARCRSARSPLSRFPKAEAVCRARQSLALRRHSLAPARSERRRGAPGATAGAPRLMRREGDWWDAAARSSQCQMPSFTICRPS